MAPLSYKLMTKVSLQWLWQWCWYTIHDQCIISASSAHHRCIIRASWVDHQGIIRASSVHHTCIIRASSVHHQGTIRVSWKPFLHLNSHWPRCPLPEGGSDKFYLAIKFTGWRWRWFLSGWLGDAIASPVSLLVIKLFLIANSSSPLWLWATPVDRELHQIQENSLPF